MEAFAVVEHLDVLGNGLAGTGVGIGCPGSEWNTAPGARSPPSWAMRRAWRVGGEVPPDRIRGMFCLFVGHSGGFVRPWLHGDQAPFAHMSATVPTLAEIPRSVFST